MNDVMSRSYGPENLNIFKKSQFGVDCRTGRQTIECLSLGHRELSSLPWSRRVGRLTLGQVDRQSGCLPLRQIVENLSSDHGVEKLGSDHGIEKLGSDHGIEKLGSDLAVGSFVSIV